MPFWSLMLRHSDSTRHSLTCGAPCCRFLVQPITCCTCIYSPSGKLLKRLTAPYLQVLPILLTVYTLSFSHLPALLSIMHLRDRGHSYTLPACTLQLYENSFINRCLFGYTCIVWWFYVSFFVVCIMALCDILYKRLRNTVTYLLIYLLTYSSLFSFYHFTYAFVVHN